MSRLAPHRILVTALGKSLSEIGWFSDSAADRRYTRACVYRPPLPLPPPSRVAAVSVLGQANLRIKRSYRSAFEAGIERPPDRFWSEEASEDSPTFIPMGRTSTASSDAWM